MSTESPVDHDSQIVVTSDAGTETVLQAQNETVLEPMTTLANQVMQMVQAELLQGVSAEDALEYSIQVKALNSVIVLPLGDTERLGKIISTYREYHPDM